MSDGTTCQPFFDFRHDISLTSNASELTSFLQSNQISGGLDPAEGILDALLQTAVCEVRMYVCCMYVCAHTVSCSYCYLKVAAICCHGHCCGYHVICCLVTPGCATC